MVTEQVSRLHPLSNPLIAFVSAPTHPLCIELAVCPNDTNVDIYNTSSPNWTVEATLKDVSV